MEKFLCFDDVKSFIDKYEVDNKVKFVCQTNTKHFGGEGMQ